MQFSLRNWPWRKIGIGVGASALAGIVLILGAWFWVTADLPSAEQLTHYEPPITSRVHAGDGKLVAEFANQHRVYVPTEEIPPRLVQAFISAEDKKFFEHSGVDWVGVVRGAVLNPLLGKRQAGGSTITQQVVKNMLVGSERSVARKIRELALAQRIEKQLDKDQILNLYMNEIYLGGRSYGVGAASLNYFGKSLGDLTLAECAMLAGLPQRPSEVNPYNHPEAAIRRRNYVIERMVQNGYITKEEGDVAKAEKLKTVDRLNDDENEASQYFVEEVRRDILKLGAEKKLAGFGSKKEAEKGFYEGGLSIRSTLDSKMQIAAETALRAGLESYDHRRGWRGPIASAAAKAEPKEALGAVQMPPGAGADWKLSLVRSVGADGARLSFLDGTEGRLPPEDIKWAAGFKRKEGGAGLKAGDVVPVARRPVPDLLSQTIATYGAPIKPVGAIWRLRQIPVVQGTLVAMDPHTGRVLAMTGGYSFAASQFNRALQAKRQPGSSFKPFVYIAALDAGRTPSTRILDAPFVDCSDPTQKDCYKPSNYSDDFYGLATLRLGIEKSRNAMTVRLAQDIGMDKVVAIGERTGIYDKLPPYLSMSLGAGETTPLRMVTAYSLLVNGGKRVKPVLIDRIQNRYGQTVYRQDARACSGCGDEWTGQAPPVLPDGREQVLDPVSAYQMVSMLQGVVERGTGTEVKAVGKPLAGKTGTTNDQFDAWFIGFTPDLVAAVWVGYDNPRDLGAGETGGRLATPIFRDFMIKALENTPGTPFRRPQGVQLVEIDADSGCLPEPNSRLVIVEAYKPGTEPTERCSLAALNAEGAGGPRVDFGRVIAGDEGTVQADRTAVAAGQAPGGLVTNLPPGLAPPPVQQKPPVKGDLTLKDGIF